MRIVRETGKPVAQVAKDLGIHEGTLGNWVKKDRAARGEGQVLSTDERAELNELRRQVAELQMERDVLKRLSEAIYSDPFVHSTDLIDTLLDDLTVPTTGELLAVKLPRAI